MRLPALVLAAFAALLAVPQVALAIDATRPGSLLPLRATVPAPSGAKGLCVAYGWACAGGTAGRMVGAAEMEQVVAINRAANGAIKPVTDEAQYHLAEKWALPTARGGDCEDYALYKKARLLEAGYAPDRLLLAAVLDKRGQSHAVLVVRAEGADLVLDNLTNSVKSWDKTGYTFLRVQDPKNPAQWVAVLAGGILPRVTS